jgi:hypothetical protein
VSSDADFEVYREVHDVLEIRYGKVFNTCLRGRKWISLDKVESPPRDVVYRVLSPRYAVRGRREIRKKGRAHPSDYTDTC